MQKLFRFLFHNILNILYYFSEPQLKLAAWVRHALGKAI